jgi:MoaA/NifB/PqqE/SkfB family radical SAM enzyme
VTPEQIQTWCDHWKKLLLPRTLVLFGGEPLMNKNIMKICRIIRDAWPSSIIRLITNGYLLSKWPQEAWFDFGEFEMQISIHRQDHEPIINKDISRILKTHNDWTTKCYKNEKDHIQIEFSRPGFRLWKSKFKDFVAPYRLHQGNLAAFDADPAHAHAICGSPNTPILYKGSLYKCPPVANLIDVTGSNWSDYQPCHDAQNLAEFVSQINQPEKVCGQCPDRRQLHVYDHMDLKNVIVKKIPN